MNDTLIDTFKFTNQFNPLHAYAALYSTDSYENEIRFDNLAANIHLNVYLLLACAICIFVVLYQMVFHVRMRKMCPVNDVCTLETPHLSQE